MTTTKTSKTKLTDWFTQDIFDTIFPYADCSALYCSDDKPFYTYQDFIAGIEWLDAHKNESFHGFCQSDNLKNSKLEMAAFLANAQQEVGDPSLLAPYPWLPTTTTSTTSTTTTATKLVGAGKAGGLLSVVEGLSPSVVVHAKGTPNPFKKQAILSTTRTSLRPVAQKLIGLDNDSVISCCVLADTSFQKQFGLAKGQGAGVVFQPGLCAVDDNGNLYGDESKSTNAADTVLPVSSIPKDVKTSGTFDIYSGRGVIQLSYNFNYSWCSLEVFGDYRLVRYPNLIITTDTTTRLCESMPKLFGFPGKNAGGKNVPPKNVLDTTPGARQLAWITCLWFWMTNRSGYATSCHACMQKPTVYGIGGANIIVNNQSGVSSKGKSDTSWAGAKIEYYKRICKILGFKNAEVTDTIVVPKALPKN